MNGPRRWVLHPRPGPLESLSSWIERLALLYGLRPDELLTVGLGLAEPVAPEDLDTDPPLQLLAALSARTGVELAHLRSMTLAGWVPWLFDTVDTDALDPQEVFATYVRDNSVLLAPGEAGVHQAAAHGVWAGPWWPRIPQPPAPVCPLCTADPDHGRNLMWQLPLVTGCAVHGCHLEPPVRVLIARFEGGLDPRPRDQPQALVDDYTHQALTRGRVVLPGREVHAATWFRLLRALLDELSLATSGRSRHGRETLTRVWQQAAIPARAGITAWRPFEHLAPGAREDLLKAAGTALQLAADGQIEARGRHAPALVYAPEPPAHHGDRPVQHPEARRPSAWDGLTELFEAAWDQAHHDPDAARQLLTLLTVATHTRARFDEERAFLIRHGIPARFLPTAAESGRSDIP